MISFIVILSTLVIYEPDAMTDGIEVYDYSEKRSIHIICPEGTYETDCLNPKDGPNFVEEKETISLKDIQSCAENNDFF